jgi:hypothetical protein
VGVLLDLFDASFGRVERQVDHALEAIVLRQDSLDQPFIVGRAQCRLDVVLRVHTEGQHRRREYNLVIEAERVHRAPRQLREMMAAFLLDLLQQRLLMGNTPPGVLVKDARLVVEQRDVRASGPLGVGLPHLADHVVVDHRQDFRPE